MTLTLPPKVTDRAFARLAEINASCAQPQALRVAVEGGGCSGFQYGFTFDEKVNEGDMTIEKQGVLLVVDPMSLQYLIGGVVDYTEGLEGSRFLVNNPNATATSGCGSSFSI